MVFSILLPLRFAICNQALGDRGGAALFQGLAANVELEELGINNCGLGQEAAEAFSSCVPSTGQGIW